MTDLYEPILRELREANQRHQDGLNRWCPACGAEPGCECDGNRIATYEGMHFARHAEVA